MTCPPTLEDLRDMPTRRIHPLAIYLMERDVGVARGAALIGVSERMLREVVAWRKRFARYRERELSSVLAIDLDDFVPPAP
ncbi:MAG: hypothetical protein KF850_34415 [Labilithrix sp.]|nr:hypothetical protein [Labilithrix sp.]MBX3217175.1 hypothetical protein [Labilithrix sp.]